MSETRKLFAYLVFLNILWSPVNLSIKVATEAGMSPMAVGLARWSLLLLVMFGSLQIPWFARITRCKWPTHKDAVLAVVFGALFLGPAHILYYTALTNSSTVVGTVLNTTAPLWVAVFSLFILREKMTWARAMAILLGTIGAYFVVLGFHMPDFSHSDSASNLRYLTATLMECLGGVLAIKLVRRNSGISILAFEVLGAVLTFGLAAVFLGKSLPVVWTQGFHMDAALSIFYLVFIPGLLCWGSWYVVAERVPINTMVVSTLVQPIVAAALAYFWTHEPLTTSMLVGAAIIVSALFVAAGSTSGEHVALPELDEQQ